MSDFTTFVEEAVRDWLSQGSDMPTAPTNLYLALHTADPTNTGEDSEVSAGDYDRVETATSADWTATGTGGPSGFENTNTIEFSTATSNWGNISWATLWDGSTSTDNSLATYELDTAKEIADGDRAEFPAGNLEFNID